MVLSAMAQSHERGAGDWQAEWSVFSALFRYTACSVEALRTSLQGLRVDPARMAENLERTRGQIMAEALTMALAAHIGRPAAQKVVAEICRQAETAGKTVKEIAQSDPRIADRLRPEGLDRALDPAAYLGSTDALIERSLGAFRHSPGDEGTPVNVTAVDGARIACEVDGPREPTARPSTIVFSNSLGTNLSMWEPQRAPLSRRLRVVRYDSRGHGGSQVPPDRTASSCLAGTSWRCWMPLGWSACTSAAFPSAEWWRCGLPHTIPSESSGAVFANTAARIGTTAVWNERISAVGLGGMAAVRDTVLARFLSSGFRARRPEVARAVGDMVEATPAHGYAAACAAVRDADLHGLLPRIRVRSLIICSEWDQSTPVEQGEELHAAIPGSQFVVLRKAAHLSNVEQSERFTDSVMQFIDQEEAAT